MQTSLHSVVQRHLLLAGVWIWRCESGTPSLFRACYLSNEQTSQENQTYQSEYHKQSIDLRFLSDHVLESGVKPPETKDMRPGDTKIKGITVDMAKYKEHQRIHRIWHAMLLSCYAKGQSVGFQTRAKQSWRARVLLSAESKASDIQWWFQMETQDTVQQLKIVQVISSTIFSCIARYRK